MSEAGLLRLLLARFTLRHWRRGPGQAVLLVTILALGVAVYFSIRLANRAVLRSFEQFTEVLSRETDFVVFAPAGSLPENILPELRAALGARPVHIIPVLETTAARVTKGETTELGSGESFRLVGLDLIGIQNLREEDASPEPLSAEWSGAGVGGNAVFVSRALGERAGAELHMVVDDRVVMLEIAGLIPERRWEPAAPKSLLIMDLPSAQALTARPGQIDRVEFFIESGPRRTERRAEAVQIISALAHDRWLVESGADRRESGATMTRAFRLNLTILSLIALLVGLYLVFQALDGAVLRRRQEIAILISLGVNERTIRRAWLVESLLVGVIGGALGALLGWGGAQFAVRFVGRTVNALYFTNAADAAHLDSLEFVWVLLLATAASLAAGWIPARHAARVPPAQLLMQYHAARQSARFISSGALAAALAVLGCAAAMLPALRMDGGVRLALGGYLAAAAWLFAGGLLSGNVLTVLGRILRPAGRHGVMIRLAASHLAPPSGRHRLAAASLACAVAMTAGMAILVGSFEHTMQRWIGATFQADLYVSSSGAQNASSKNRLRAESWQRLAADPAVLAANVMHSAEVTFSLGTATVLGVDFRFAREQGSIAWIGGAPQPWPEKGEAAFVSEAFVERFGVPRGGVLSLPTPDGPRTLPVAGVFADYGSERGTVLVDRVCYLAWFHDESARSVILKLRDPAAAEAVRSRWLAEFPGLQVFTNAHLRTEVLRIFRQTFSITYVLEAIGVGVAVLGLALTLGSVLLDRQADLTTLRALGVTRGGIALSSALEGAATALAGLLAGLAASVLLGWLLIHVINKQTFGWTLLLAVPMPALVLLAALVLIGALGAATVVGFWGADLPADREE